MSLPTTGAASLIQAILAALATIVALLALCAAAALSPRLRDRAGLVVIGLCGLGSLLAFAALLGGAPRAVLAVPLGLPGGIGGGASGSAASPGMTLGLDALSAPFLLLVFVAATAAALFARPERGIAAALLPAFVAGMALTLLAADGFALLLGFEAMSLASWGLVLSGRGLAARPDDPGQAIGAGALPQPGPVPPLAAPHGRVAPAQDGQAATRDAGLLYLGMAAFGAACLIPAIGLLAPAAGTPLAGVLPDLRFAAMRLAPPEGGRAAAVLALVLLGAGSKAGLAPLHPWLPVAHPAAPSHASALMSGAMTKVALYVLLRLVFDLCGEQPLWWGLPLLAMGVASAVLGAVRANLETDLKAVLAASTIENVGLIAAGLGLVLIARAADLPSLASLALGAALLHVLNHGVFKTLLFLCAGAVQHGAGTRRLDRLGGLIHRMPVTTLCILVGSASLAALPPSSGFASEWLLLQAALAAPRSGSLAVQTVLAVAIALLALAAALAAAAAVRLVGIGFLGRPRTPRAAAAEEAPRHERASMLGLAALSAALGLLPGPVLRLLDPALHLLTGAGMEERAGLLAAVPQAQSPGYSAPAAVLLLAACLALVLVLARRFAVGGARRGPAWDCGYGNIPPWLPFGDPATQYGPASFGQPLRRILGTSLFAARERVDMPRPGETRPARFDASWRDPAEAWINAPVLRARAFLSAQADRIQVLTIRRALVVTFAALVLFLAIVGGLEAR